VRPATRSARRAGLAGLVVLLVSLLALPSAMAQSGSQLLLRQIDSNEPSRSRADFIWTGNESDLASAKIVVNGTQVPAEGANKLNPGQARTGVALVIDTGPNMDQSNALVSAKEAARTWIDAAAGDGTQFAIYGAGDRVNLVQNFTGDKERLKAALDRLGPTKQSSLWATVRQAGSSFLNTNLQPNVVVIAGDPDNVTPNDYAAASGAVLSSGATAFAVNFLGPGYDPSQLNQIVTQAGGFSYQTGDGNQVGSLVGNVQTSLSSQQYRINFDAGLQPGQVAEIELTVGGSSTKASVVLGGVAKGNQALNPTPVGSPLSLPLLDSAFGLIVVVGLVLLAAALLAYAVTLLFVKDDQLSSVLQAYDGVAGVDEFEDEGQQSIAKSALIQRAVEITEQVAESQGYLGRTEAALERANLPLRAGEALFFYVAFVVVMTLIFLLLMQNLIGALVVGVIAALLPVAVVSYMASRRRKAFMAQLPDTLQLLSGTLRAGYSLMQGVEAVAQEVAEPMGLELRRVVTEARLGRPLEESLENTAERMNSPDFAWAVMAIRIQREVGGNLAELLLTVAETMTARERLRRDVAALTAEGRMSAIVLGALPVLLGLAMFVINPEYIGVLFKDGLGIAMLIMSIVSMLIGFFWMKKIITIEI